MFCLHAQLCPKQPPSLLPLPVSSILSLQWVKATDSSDLVIVPLKESIQTNQNDSLLNKA